MKKKDVFLILLAFILVFTGFTSSTQPVTSSCSPNSSMKFSDYSVQVTSKTEENGVITVICTIKNTSNYTLSEDKTVITVFASQDGRRLERVCDCGSLGIERIDSLKPGEKEVVEFRYVLQEDEKPVKLRFIAYDGYSHTITLTP